MIIDIIIAREVIKMKYSKQRSLILEIVKSNPVHPTAEWVYEQARKKMPGIGIATVYRNLNVLAEQGQIGKIVHVDGVDRFDCNTSEHYHLQCNRCGKLSDLPVRAAGSTDRLKQVIQETFDLPEGEIVITTTLLKGLCADCAKTEANGN